MKKLRAGIIGLGRIASLYEQDKRAKQYYPYLTHAGTFMGHPKIELICGTDQNRTRLSDFKNMWKIENLYTDYKKMLQENNLDILSICTYPDKHYEIIKSASQRVKVIFCEKPFTNGSDEIKKIIELKKKHNIKIAINLYREYDRSHLEIRRLIKSGEFGKVQRVNCFYGNGLRNMGTHLLAYLIGTFGLPLKIKVLRKGRFKGLKEFTYDVYLEFKKNIPVFIQGCDFNKFRLFEMDFICERGRIQVLEEGLSITTFIVDKNKSETGACELVKKSKKKSSIGQALYWAANHLVELSKNKQSHPIVSPEKYLDLQLLIEDIEKQGR